MFLNHVITKYKLIIFQLILLGIIAITSAVMSNWHNFISVLLGGIAWIIPSIYFVKKFLKIKKVHDPQKLLKDFLLSEVVKLLISMSLIILILCYFTINTWSFLSGYVPVVIASQLFPFLCKNNKQ